MHFHAENFELIKMGAREMKILVYTEVHEFSFTRSHRFRNQNFTMKDLRLSTPP